MQGWRGRAKVLAKFVGARASWPNLSAVPSGAQLRSSTARKEAVANSSDGCITHAPTPVGLWHMQGDFA